jgi:hypothetical protein
VKGLGANKGKENEMREMNKEMEESGEGRNIKERKYKKSRVERGE